ncbi:uncharacterized protein LOC129596282, partial [Paramacrobiotus metropolitanus]|uniref:uncharacterized protein LOC129596282 n=1 Tax=Paramacrobiotus metropolitanus TaxID=2943436 RepID=UPI0024465324
MVAAIQAAAQVRPAPQNVAPPVPQNVAPMNVGLPQQGVGNGNFGGNGYGNGNWNGGQGNFQNQGQGQGNFQPNRGNQNYQQNQGSRTEFKFQMIDGWVANNAQMCQYCMYGNHQTQGCKFANTPPEQNPNLFAFREWQRLRGLGGWRQAVANGYDIIAQWYQHKASFPNQQGNGNYGNGNGNGGQGGGNRGGYRGGFRGRNRGYGRGNWNGGNRNGGNGCGQGNYQQGGGQYNNGGGGQNMNPANEIGQQQGNVQGAQQG